MKLVLDASMTGAWLLPDEGSQRADKLLRRILVGDDRAHVPALWSYEIANLLLTAHRRHRLDGGQLEEASSLVAMIPCQRHDQDQPARRERLLHIAQRFELSAYDAAYLELADDLQCALASLDGRLVEASRQMSLPAVR